MLSDGIHGLFLFFLSQWGECAFYTFAKQIEQLFIFLLRYFLQFQQVDWLFYYCEISLILEMLFALKVYFV